MPDTVSLVLLVAVKAAIAMAMSAVILRSLVPVRQRPRRHRGTP